MFFPFHLEKQENKRGLFKKIKRKKEKKKKIKKRNFEIREKIVKKCNFAKLHLVWGWVFFLFKL